MDELVYVTTAFYPARNGYANAASNLVRDILHHGDARLHLFTDEPLPDGQEEMQHECLRVTRVPRGGGPQSVVQSWRIYRAILHAHREPRRVFIESGEYPLLARLLQRRWGSEWVRLRLHASYDTEFLAWRGRASDRLNRAMLSSVLRASPVVCATNRYHTGFAARHFLEGNRYMLAKKRFVVLPNAIEVKPRGTAGGAGPFFFTLGRMDDESDVEQKGFIDLIDAWAMLRRDHDVDGRVVLCGSGRQRAFLQARAERLGVASSVEFVGRLSEEDLGSMIRDAIACVLPSRYEGFSMFAAEVAAAGAILVGTRETGLEDIVVDGETGFLVPPHDVETLARAMKRVADLPDDEWDAMRENAARHMARHCAPERLVRILDSLWS